MVFDDATLLLKEWRERNLNLKSLKARVRIFISTSEGEKAFKAMYVVLSPDKFRIEIITPFGQTVAALATDGENIYGINFRENVCLKDRLNLNLEKFVPFKININKLTDILLSRIPVIDEGELVNYNIDKNYVEYFFKNNAGEEVEVNFIKEDFTVKGVLEEINFTYQQFLFIDGIYIPSRIVLENHNSKVIIELENPVINSDMDKQDFVLSIPDDCLITEGGIF
jgi:hypothetical protein